MYRVASGRPRERSGRKMTRTPMVSVKMSDETESSSDESLDIKSVKFDPLKALYSPKFGLSIPNAKIYDNLSKYEAVIKGLSLSVNTRESKKEEENAELAARPRRIFLPHQEPVAGSSKTKGQKSGEKDNERKNVLTRMQKSTLGPLDMLRRCMEHRTRVKVYTRGARNIRGYVLAYVVAFDKHWNLALEDCLEVWSRKVKRKAPALGETSSVDATEATPGGCNAVVKETKGKIETLERHVPQMMVRGEQVAVIVKTD